MELLCYTREPKEELIYAECLANSMHLAWRNAGGRFRAFRHNEGILYAKAVQDSKDGTWKAKSLSNPWIFRMKEGGYGIAAIRIETDGKPDIDAEGCVLLFWSYDLAHYEEIGLCRLQEKGHILEIRCEYISKAGCYHFFWRSEDGLWRECEWKPDLQEQAETEGRSLPASLVSHDEQRRISQEPMIGKAEYQEKDFVNIEGIKAYHSIEISDAEGLYLRDKLGDSMTASGEAFPFPYIEERADPFCMYWKGSYYFIATNDADQNQTLSIRRADKLQGLAAAEEQILLDTHSWPEIKGLLWAPEIHTVKGRLYMFFAATSGDFYGEEVRVMQLREHGDPMCRADWMRPRSMQKKDGSPLCEEGRVISLDMTVFEEGGKDYAVWSQRQLLPADQGAWLYIAQIDGEQPWRLLSDPVCLAVPEYGWENNHAFVVEGPYALWYHGKLMLTYSGSAVDATYTVGCLVHRSGAPILDPIGWVKGNYPLLSSRSVEGEFGTGHNSYVKDENGTLWNFYHARKTPDSPRSCGIRKVYFDIDGEPVLDAVI